MSWETLPDWFWKLYYTVLLMTLVTALISVVRKRIIRISLIAIALVMTIPFVSLIFSMGRADGMNEFEHLITQLQHGELWSIFVTLGYGFLLVWWVLFFRNIWTGKKAAV